MFVVHNPFQMFTTGFKIEGPDDRWDINKVDQFNKTPFTLQNNSNVLYILLQYMIIDFKYTNAVILKILKSMDLTDNCGKHKNK